MSDLAGQFEFRTVKDEDIDAICPLWKQLRAYHASMLGDQPPFLFEPRKKGLLAKAAGGRLRIELVSDGGDARDIAYCVATVTAEGAGEVDSLFVEQIFRKRGIGGELLRRALAWFDEAEACSRVVNVASANREAMAFYARFGFEPRTTLLQQRRPA